MDNELECWEDSLCFWVVPIAIIFVFAAIGCVCGLCCVFCSQKDVDADEGDTGKENRVIK